MVKGAQEIYVRIGRGHDAVVKAEVVEVREDFDLAILEMEDTGYYSATLDVSDTIQLGDEIVILGYPFGAKMSDDVMEMSMSFTRGYVSSHQVRNGWKQVFLDISAKAGNSGSPVIDLSTGMVVGVLAGSVLGGVNNREEVNYMIPASYIESFVAE